MVPGRRALPCQSGKRTGEDERYVGDLDVAVFCGDSGQRIVGQLRQGIDLNLTDPTYERFMKEGIVHEARVPVTGSPLFMKVVVFDPGSNLMGSQMSVMK